MADNENNKSHVSREFLDNLYKAGLAPEVPYRPDLTANTGEGASQGWRPNGWAEWTNSETSTFGKKGNRDEK